MDDLPQLFIQGFYLMTSGDTGNLVVLVSVSVSGCSLLLRCVRRGAFAFITSAGESKLAETSSIKDWDEGRLSEWLAGVAAEVPALASFVQRNQGLFPPMTYLALLTTLFPPRLGSSETPRRKPRSGIATSSRSPTWPRRPSTSSVRVCDGNPARMGLPQRHLGSDQP